MPRRRHRRDRSRDPHRDLRRRPAPLPRLHARVRAGNDARPRVRRRRARRGRRARRPRARAARGQHEHDLRRDLRALPRRAARRSASSRALFGYSGVYPRLEGGQADLVRVPRADRCLWPIPDDVSDEDAVFVADILPTGFLAVQRAARSVQATSSSCSAAGRSGLMALICAVGTARRVIAVDGIPARRGAGRSRSAPRRSIRRPQPRRSQPRPRRSEPMR